MASQFRLIIDTRESAVIKTIQDSSSDMAHTTELLDVGDFHIRNIETGECIYIIERKTVADLLASIKDGRYNEQKARMRAMIDQKKTRDIIFIIEGIEPISPTTDNTIIQGALLSMTVRDGLKVLRTSGVIETVAIINRLIARLTKSPEEFSKFSSASFSGGGGEYIDAIKAKKSANIDREVFQYLVLAQIPGISIQMGKCIIEHYGSISKLLDAYRAIHMEPIDKKRELMLADLKVGSRKLGPVASTRIYNFLL